MPSDSMKKPNFKLTLILADFGAQLDPSIAKTCITLFRESDVPFTQLPTCEPSVCQWSLNLSSEHRVPVFQAELKQRLAVYPVDLNIILHKVTPSTIKLIVFDMDSTLIAQEVLDEMAAIAGPQIEAQVKSVTKQSMRGEMDFESSLRQRVSFFAGLPVEPLFDAVLRSRMTLTPGAREFLQYCRERNIKTAICSGGFFPMIQTVQQWLDIDLAYGNIFETVIDEHGIALLTGTVQGHVFAAADKRTVLIQLASQLGLDLCTETMAIGDGANDLPMLTTAAIGIAYNAKPIVKEKASHSIDCNSMKSLQYLVN